MKSIKQVGNLIICEGFTAEELRDKRIKLAYKMRVD
jgi:hypothetical protein